MKLSQLSRGSQDAVLLKIKKTDIKLTQNLANTSKDFPHISFPQSLEWLYKTDSYSKIKA